MPILGVYLKQYYYECITVFLFGLILLLVNVLPYAVFNALSYFNKAFILFIVIMIIFELKSFTPFFLALISLAIVPIMLILKKGELAESLAIAAYYFLVIGVIKEIASLRRETKIS